MEYPQIYIYIYTRIYIYIHMLKHHDFAMTYELENSGDSSFQNLCVLRTHGIRPGTTLDPQNQKGHVIAQICKVGAIYIQFQNSYPITINISTYTKSLQQYIKSHQHISTLLSHHFHPFPSIHFSRTPAWDLKNTSLCSKSTKVSQILDEGTRGIHRPAIIRPHC